MTHAIFIFAAIAAFMMNMAHADDIAEIRLNTAIQFSDVPQFLTLNLATLTPFGSLLFANLVTCSGPMGGGCIKVTGVTSSDIYQMQFKMQLKLRGEDGTKKNNYHSGTVTLTAIAYESGAVIGTCVGRDYISPGHYYGTVTAFCTFSGDQLGSTGEIGFFVNQNIPFDLDNGSLDFAVSVTKKA